MTDETQIYCQVFQADELTNEAYHEETDHVSGSSLHKMLTASMAGWRFQKQKDEAEKAKEKESTGAKQKPLIFGTTGHTCMLEPSRFEADFFRMPDPSDHPNALTSVAGVCSWLKEKGIGGYSGKKIPDLYPLVDMTGESVEIWQRIWEAAQAKAGEREQVPAKDYDRVLMMREVLLNNHDYSRIIYDGVPELSIYVEIDGVKVKVRLDRVTTDAAIVDYKTSQSAEPEKFGRLAFDNGYWLKMALQHDAFEIAYGQKPSSTNLLVQEKEEPYLAMMYELTPEQLMIGRMQYKTALQMFRACRDADVWPGYAGGVATMKLSTPGYIQARFKEYFKVEG